MFVKMKQTRLAAPDGIHVVTLKAGETVDLPDTLAASYLERKIATTARAPRGRAAAAPSAADDSE